MGNFGEKMRYVTFRLDRIEREAPEEYDSHLDDEVGRSDLTDRIGRSEESTVHLTTHRLLQETSHPRFRPSKS